MFELAGPTTTLGVRHGLDLLRTQKFYSGGWLVSETTVKGGMSFERILICYGPAMSNSASSGFVNFPDIAR